MQFLSNWRKNHLQRKIRTVIREEYDVRHLQDLFDRLQRYQPHGFPPIFILDACEFGRLEALETVLGFGSHIDLNEISDRIGRRPLHLAVEAGSEECVRLLLARGADPNIRDNDGVSPLILCKSMQGTAGISAILLSAGADPKQVDKNTKDYLM